MNSTGLPAPRRLDSCMAVSDFATSASASVSDPLDQATPMLARDPIRTFLSWTSWLSDSRDPDGGAHRFGRGGDAGAHDEELVAPHPAHDVVLAHRPAQPPGHHAQEFVPGVVALALVELLEVVEVDEDRRRPVPFVGPRQQGLQGRHRGGRGCGNG